MARNFFTGTGTSCGELILAINRYGAHFALLLFIVAPLQVTLAKLDCAKRWQYNERGCPDQSRRDAFLLVEKEYQCGDGPARSFIAGQATMVAPSGYAVTAKHVACKAPNDIEVLREEYGRSNDLVRPSPITLHGCTLRAVRLRPQYDTNAPDSSWSKPIDHVRLATGSQQGPDDCTYNHETDAARDIALLKTKREEPTVAGWREFNSRRRPHNY